MLFVLMIFIAFKIGSSCPRDEAGDQYLANTLNKEHADETGHISMARIIERQPSFKGPMEKGLRFTVISGALVLRCPGLFVVCFILIDLHS